MLKTIPVKKKLFSKLLLPCSNLINPAITRVINEETQSIIININSVFFILLALK